MSTPAQAQSEQDTGGGHYVGGSWVSQVQERETVRADLEAAAARDWMPGAPWPDEYRGKRYQVNEINAPYLRNPPPGTVWYRLDNNFVLVRRDDGTIVDVLKMLE